MSEFILARLSVSSGATFPSSDAVAKRRGGT